MAMHKNLDKIALIAFLFCIPVQATLSDRSFAQATIDRKAQATQLLEQGTQLYANKKYPEALATWQKSLEIFRALKSPSDEAKLLGNIGLAHYYMGNYQQAIAFHEQSLAIRIKINDRQGQGNSYHNLGVAHESLGQYDKAIDLYKQALTIRQQLGDRIGDRVNEWHTLGGLIRVYYALGKHQENISLYQQIITISRDLKDRQGEANAVSNLGLTYYSLQQFQQAIDWEHLS
jgi:tetratricopeptide (TPR) repeat protein